MALSFYLNDISTYVVCNSSSIKIHKLRIISIQLVYFLHYLHFSVQIHVFDTHLSLNAPARKISAKEIADFMTDYEGPAFIMGDFNAEPNESSIK